MRTQVSFFELLGFLTRAPGALRRRAETRRHRKLMRDAPRFAVADLPENTFGKVTGTVRPWNNRLLEAPLSGRLCVYYEAYVDGTVGGSTQRVLASEHDGVAFTLVDGDARALVDPAHAVMSIVIDHVSTSPLFVATDRQQAMLDRHKPFGESLDFEGMRYREAIIQADERVAVYGGGVREPDPEARSESYRGAGAATRLCLSGSERFPLFISDDPRSL